MADTEERQMLPEVQAYITARGEAETVLQQVQLALDGKYNDAYNQGDYYAEEKREQRQAHGRELEEAHTKYRIAQNEAWNTLTKSSDPLVRWIAEHCKDYQGYALEVLKALPATVDELDELASGENWCNIWDQFRERAEAAGVLPGTTPPTPARTAVLDYFARETYLNRPRRRQLNRLLDEFKAEEIAA